MDIVIAGGHGQIALRLERLLVAAGHRVRGLIRNPDHAGDLHDAGAEAVVADLEELDIDALADLIGDADAIVFAAGAGPGSGPQRKWTLDYAGAVKLIEVARRNSIARYVIVSSVGADPEADDDGGFGTYLRAKGQADKDLTESGLDYTVIRPGPLTDDPGTGAITIGPAHRHRSDSARRRRGDDRGRARDAGDVRARAGPPRRRAAGRPGTGAAVARDPRSQSVLAGEQHRVELPPVVPRVTWMRPSGCLLPARARAFSSCVRTARYRSVSQPRRSPGIRSSFVPSWP